MKVSVIIPCYNVEKYIDRCLKSVVHQTIGLEQLEIICVNDASTDKTLKKLKLWEQLYPDNILVIDCKQNGKLGKARNIGLSYVTGDFIVFLDADDWMEIDAYKLASDKMKEYSCDIVRYQLGRDTDDMMLWRECSRREEKDFLITIQDDEERKKFLVTDIMDNGCTNKMYRREFISENNLSFPEGVTYEDIYWGMLSQFYVKRIYFLNEKLYHYYINPNSIVLKKNEAYHMDIFTTTMKMWNESEKRGALEKYPMEMELNFLVYFYLGGLKMLALRYSDLKYQEYRNMCAIVRKTIPNYRNNIYIKQVLDEKSQLQVALIEQNISELEFAQLVNLIRGNV